MPETLLIKLQACNFINKESLAQLFSCEFCKISKNTFFTEHLRTTALLQRSLLVLFSSVNRCFVNHLNRIYLNQKSVIWGEEGHTKPFFQYNCGRSHLRLCNKIQLMHMFSEVVTRGLQKRDSNTSVFLLNLQKFWEHLFWRTSPNNCFCIFQMFNPFLVDDPILYPKGFLIFFWCFEGV